MTTHSRTDNAVPATTSLSVSPGSPPQLLAKAACASSGCPSIYRDGDRLIVQGYAVSPGQAGLEVPEGEFLVEIPVDVLSTAARLID